MTHAWVGDRLGARFVDGPGPRRLADLAGLAVRRNPRRAHLVVSKVLGKHVPVDPRVAYGAARDLGALAAAALGGADPLVLGYAETATALGHAVSDAFPGARYLHSTRRHVPGIVPVGTFDEAHSHATEHLLLPADPAWLASPAPVVLVDDELTTGRTAVGTIRALHAIRPRDRYVVATLLDLRGPADRAAFGAAAADLSTRIDVVALASGSVALPPDVLDRARDLVATLDAAPAPPPSGARAPVQRVTAGWDIPEGGRHGFAPSHRPGLDVAVSALAGGLELPGGPVLVLGTEELMYAPLRLALALADRHPHVRFSSTTRSPVLPVDDPGYAIRTALRFAAHDGTGDGADDGPRFAYNVAGAGFAGVVLVVDATADTPALWAPDGLVEALRPVCGALTVVTLPVWAPVGVPAV